MFGLKSLVIFSLITSILLIIITYYIDHPYKEKENLLSNLQFAELYLNRYFHWVITLIIGLYIIFVRYNKNYDIFFIICTIIIILHWFILGNGECLISYREKNILDPTYKKGDNPPLQLFSYIVKYKTHYILKDCLLRGDVILIGNIAYVILRLIYYNFVFPKARYLSSFIR